MNVALMTFLLEQTAQEKRLTILYITLFVVAMGMLVLDTFAMKKWSPKGVNVLLYIILIIAIVALVVLLATSYGK